MRKILISYRGDDCTDTERIYQRLRRQFGGEAVHKDFWFILGRPFNPRYLAAEVARGTILLAVIGPHWIKIPLDNAPSWLEDPQYHVRIEIESALKHGIPVVPVIVREASIPAADRLPRSMQKLAFCPGIAVRADLDFHDDMDRLIDYIKIQTNTHRRKSRGTASPCAKDGRGQDALCPPNRDYVTRETSAPNGSHDTQTVRSGGEPLLTVTPRAMVTVTRGTFLYGKNKERQTLDYDYLIGMYPVTNEEFGAFLAADGYQNQAYWSQEGWLWRTAQDIECPMYWKEPEWNAEWNIPDHPVVGVSYYEAEAYAKWAGRRLPNEQEWEKAARGTGGRIYPWGNWFRSTRCNARKDIDSSTTPVTKYTSGVSPYGCHDMAGNVWEWCASWYDEKKHYRVLRGGSWYGWPEILRCSERHCLWVGARGTKDGFRLAQDMGRTRSSPGGQWHYLPRVFKSRLWLLWAKPLTHRKTWRKHSRD